MLGCDLHCGYCQNWVSSQALRDPAASLDFHDADAGQLAGWAQRHGCEFVVSTYNEPLITAEWARDVFREARRLGMRTGFVSNGNATPEALEYLRPVLDIYKVDLKTFDDRRYRQLGGRIGPILDSIRMLHSLGIWLEIVTLLVPGFNDSERELEQLTGFIAGVSADIPWHVTAFHSDYRMIGIANTECRQLEMAAAIGRAAGLRYVYAGNCPGMVGRHEDTCCPGCGAELIRRTGFRVIENRLETTSGRCPECAAAIPGIWNEASA
jgi:pyruvate formate lyase activating enzyme